MAVEETGGQRYARQLLAELVGTGSLVFVAAGADVIDAQSGGQIGHVARYFAPGLLIVAMIWSLSAVSGAHFNPAVTLAFVAVRAFPAGKALGYWAAQFAGAIASAYLLRLFFGNSIGYGVTHPGPDVSTAAALGWEAIITGLLVVVILSTAAEKAVVGRNAALAVGLIVACCGLFSSPITGASMNPARSLGPQLAAQDWRAAWIYFAGPFSGAAAAAGLCALLHGGRPEARQSVQGES